MLIQADTAITLAETLRSLTPFALLGLAWWQKRSADDRAELRAKADKDSDRITALEVHNAELRTHVGVDGNGLTQQMKDLIGEVRGLRGDLTDAMQEMAENRGANRTKGH